MNRNSRLMQLALEGKILTPTTLSSLQSGWTLFDDTKSGGYFKEPWKKIYIEADVDVAIRVFSRIFGHNPTWTECQCCGQNYEIERLDMNDDFTFFSLVDKSGLFIKATDILDEWKLTTCDDECCT